MNTYLTDSNNVCLPVTLPGQQPGRATERGVALVITLLILSLVTVLSLGMVIALSSQTLIGGYYRNYRGAFYAADSGLNIARQQLGVQLEALIPGTFALPPGNANACGSNANVAGAGTTVQANYAAPTTLNTGTASQSWNENFQISNATTAVLVPVPGVNTYTCTYTYDITSVGSAQGSEQQTVEEQGKIMVVVNGPATQTNLSFAYFGAFVDRYPDGLGPLVPGTMTGPMFTNNAWEFMAAIPPWTAPYIFTDPVGQHESQVDYWDSGWGQHWSTGTSWGSGANLVAPDFEQGLNLNQPVVTLSPNSFNQAEAVVDGLGTSWGSGISQSQTVSNLAAAGLQNASGQTYTGTSTPGIYFNKQTAPYSTQSTPGTTCPVNVSPPCMAGGGFYVEGGADVQLIPVGSRVQEYVITQNGVSTTITVDPGAPASGTTPAIPATTTIVSGSTTVTLNGVPEDTVTGTPQPSTMVYVDGTMYFHGPGEGQGAIQDNAMITLTSNGDAIATGDVLYKTEPVTVPLDTLVPGVGNQVLGIFTPTGSFITQDAQADQNIQVDGSIATILPGSPPNCDGHNGGQLSYGHINTINNVGGMIQSCIYAADVNAENTWFDRRFTARPGFAPPWFPQTSLTLGGPQNSNASLLPPQRIQWLSKSSQ
jgi:Tfp pilus assembly protein PilX